MISSVTPINEEFRLKALYDLDILDTPPEKEFDDLTKLASYICETDIALISLVDKDRQWFKSKYQLQVDETPRDQSFCAHALHQPDEPFIIEDARNDYRFQNNPLTAIEKIVISYAGVPLLDESGYALGTLCVINKTPKKLNDQQITLLKSLANQVSLLFKIKKKNRDLNQMKEVLEEKNQSLKEFSRVISHDLKMPLANIIATSDLLKFHLKDQLDEESLEYFEYIKKSSFSMNDYIDDILNHYESANLVNGTKQTCDLNDLLLEIEELLIGQQKCTLIYPEEQHVININASALKQILINLISNSIKYNDKPHSYVAIGFDEDSTYYYFKVSDNGMGIPEDQLENIFDLFTIATSVDKNGKKGNGIGLSTVKKLIENLDGTISVSSKIGKETSFSFTVKK